MSKKQKKDKAARSTRQLMAIEKIKDYCIATRMGNLVFFIIKPTNISVLPDSSISARIYALLNVVKGQAEIEMLALNSKESFERNKDFYRERLSQEELPAVRRLLEQDSKHLDRIQVLMASSREFYIMPTVKIWSVTSRSQIRRKMRICVEPMPFPDAVALLMSLL